LPERRFVFKTLAVLIFLSSNRIISINLLDETLVSQPNLSGWAVSTLPSERTRCSEFFSVEATPLRTLFGMSTSCTFNKFSIQTAEDALIRFMIGCNNILDKKDNILDFADSLVGM
jgi:hypothetical protein